MWLIEPHFTAGFLRVVLQPVGLLLQPGGLGSYGPHPAGRHPMCGATACWPAATARWAGLLWSTSSRQGWCYVWCYSRLACCYSQVGVRPVGTGERAAELFSLLQFLVLLLQPVSLMPDWTWGREYCCYSLCP